MSQNEIYLVCKGGGCLQIKGISPLLKCPSGSVERFVRFLMNLFNIRGILYPRISKTPLYAPGNAILALF